MKTNQLMLFGETVGLYF